MAVTLCYMSGSPYAWRAWLALVHKGIEFTLRRMSYDAGDFKSAEFLKLMPRKRVPVLIDDDFVLYESAAIVDYVEERWPQPSLFSADLHRRAIERRLIRGSTNISPTAWSGWSGPCCSHRRRSASRRASPRSVPTSRTNMRSGRR